MFLSTVVEEPRIYVLLSCGFSFPVIFKVLDHRLGLARSLQAVIY